MADNRMYRRWHPTFGLGYYVTPDGSLSGRFEADGGVVIPLDVVSSCVGRPEYARRFERSKTRMPKMDPEDNHWWTMTLRSGEVFAFRDGPPTLEAK